MSRNKGRLKASAPQSSGPATPPQGGPLGFSIPTEVVPLPSKGKFYPPDHPLHNKEYIEIRFMTAKEEDVLASPSFLAEGIALDRLLENVIVDGNIDHKSLLASDRNALLIASRVTGYGEGYETTFYCDHCGAKNDCTVDLTEFAHENITKDEMEEMGITIDGGICKFHIDKLDVDVSIRIATHGDQLKVDKTTQNKVELGLPEAPTTDFLKTIITEIHGTDDKTVISHVVDLMPALDARRIKKIHQLVSPRINTEVELTCSKCEEVSRLEVPFTAGFFWPDL